MDRKFVDFSVEFVSILLIATHQFNADHGCQVSWIFYMSSEEASTQDSVDLLSEVSSLDNDSDRMYFESASSDEEIPDDEGDLNIWSKIQSDSDGKFLEDHEIVEQVMPTPEKNTINPIDCYRYFIIFYLTSCLSRNQRKVFFYTAFSYSIAWPTSEPHRLECVKDVGIHIIIRFPFICIGTSHRHST